MDATKKNYFRNAENMNEWIQKLRDLVHKRKESIKEKAHLLNPVLNSLRGK